MQRHPFKQLIMHLDFQRVSANTAIRVNVPLHFVNQDKSPAGKSSEVVLTHELNEVEVSCLPKDLPEFIEVDLGEMKLGDTVHLSDVKAAARASVAHKDRRRAQPAVAVARHARAKRPKARRSARRRKRRSACRQAGLRGRRGVIRGCARAVARRRVAFPIDGRFAPHRRARQPGPEHARTRHNAGFRFIDALADEAGGRFGLESKLFGETTKVEFAGRSLWLLKPATTFMNLSGKSITAALRYWKIEPEEMLVAHDELDLPPGVARLKFDGGHGGQNGLRDSMRLLGHGKFHRLRIGIGHPGHKDKVTPWVLGRPSLDGRRG